MKLWSIRMYAPASRHSESIQVIGCNRSEIRECYDNSIASFEEKSSPIQRLPLFGRTMHIAKRTKYATIARLGTKDYAAAGTDMHDLSVIGRHL